MEEHSPVSPISSDESLEEERKQPAPTQRQGGQQQQYQQPQQPQQSYTAYAPRPDQRPASSNEQARQKTTPQQQQQQQQPSPSHAREPQLYSYTPTKQQVQQPQYAPPPPQQQPPVALQAGSTSQSMHEPTGGVNLPPPPPGPPPSQQQQQQQQPRPRPPANPYTQVGATQQPQATQGAERQVPKEVVVPIRDLTEYRPPEPLSPRSQPTGRGSARPTSSGSGAQSQSRDGPPDGSRPNPRKHPSGSGEEDTAKYWGYLLQKDKCGTDRFNRLLRGIATHISSTIEPKRDNPDLTPSQLSKFYLSVGGDYTALFKETMPASIAFIYKSLGCLHSLQPAHGDDGYTDPSIPCLKPQGFVTWQTIQLLLGPQVHIDFLQNAVKQFEIKDPETGRPFPRELPRGCFPTEPDPEMVRWYETVSDRLRSEAEAEEKARLASLNLEAQQAERLRLTQDAQPPISAADRTDNERGGAARYFANPFFTGKDGRPGILRRFSRHKSRSPQRHGAHDDNHEMSLGNKAKESGKTVGRVLKNVANPNLWTPRRKSDEHHHHHHHHPRRSSASGSGSGSGGDWDDRRARPPSAGAYPSNANMSGALPGSGHNRDSLHPPRKDPSTGRQSSQLPARRHSSYHAESSDSDTWEEDNTDEDSVRGASPRPSHTRRRSHPTAAELAAASMRPPSPAAAPPPHSSQQQYYSRHPSSQRPHSSSAPPHEVVSPPPAPNAPSIRPPSSRPMDDPRRSAYADPRRPHDGPPTPKDYYPNPYDTPPHHPPMNPSPAAAAAYNRGGFQPSDSPLFASHVAQYNQAHGYPYPPNPVSGVAYTPSRPSNYGSPYGYGPMPTSNPRSRSSTMNYPPPQPYAYPPPPGASSGRRSAREQQDPYGPPPPQYPNASRRGDPRDPREYRDPRDNGPPVSGGGGSGDWDPSHRSRRGESYSPSGMRSRNTEHSPAGRRSHDWDRGDPRDRDRDRERDQRERDRDRNQRERDRDRYADRERDRDRDRDRDAYDAPPPAPAPQAPPYPQSMSASRGHYDPLGRGDIDSRPSPVEMQSPQPQMGMRQSPAASGGMPRYASPVGGGSGRRDPPPPRDG